MERLCKHVLLLTLAIVLCASYGCRGGINLDADDFARMIKSGEVAAGKPLPEPPRWHYVWGDLYENAGKKGDWFFTGIARDRARVITIYTHNSIAFAACTVAEPRHTSRTASPTIVWHFFDADLMKRHVEASQEEQRRFEAAQ